MAVVGPLRALFVAQGQALFNQLRREAGGAGLAGAAVVAVLVPVALAAPTAGAYFAGAGLGRLVVHPERGARALLILSGLLLLIPLGLGLLAGLLGTDDDSGLSVRGYPVSRRTRLAAKLLSSALGLLPILAFGGLAGLAAGLCVARPAFAPVALLLCAQTAVWVLIVQHAAGRLRAAGLGRPIFGVAALAACGLLVQVKQAGRPVLAAVGRPFLDGLPYSPTTFGAQGLVDIAFGRFALGGLRQLLPLAVTALAIELTARQLARADRAGGVARFGGAASERLWSFGSPARGIARLFVLAVTGSQQGLTMIFIPGFIAGSVVALSSGIAEDLQRRPPPPAVAAWIPSSLDAVPIFGLLPFVLVHLNSELWLNQWGWDGRVVRTLFVAPVAIRELLFGKLMGFATIVLTQLLTTAPLLALLRRPRLPELLWGLGAGVFALFVMIGLGHVLSAGLSRPVDERGRIGRSEGFAAMLAGVFVLVAAAAPVVFTYAIARPWGEWGQALALWALAAAGFAGYWRALPFIGRRVRDMREQFLEAT